MTSEELAEAVAQVIADCGERIMTVGAEQYSEEDSQRFERMKLTDLIEYVNEEALDLVNYGVMVSIRMQRLGRAVALIESRREGVLAQ